MIDHQVQNLDIMPTILELAGIHGPTNMQGRSLVTLLNGTGVATWKESPAITETLGEIPGAPAETKEKPHFGIIDHGWKLVRKELGPEAQQELFEHPVDNLNLTNVIRSDPSAAHAKALLDTLEGWKTKARAAQLPSDDKMSQNLSSEELRRLRALGYVGGGGPAKPAAVAMVSTNGAAQTNAAATGPAGDKKDGR